MSRSEDTARAPSAGLWLAGSPRVVSVTCTLPSEDQWDMPAGWERIHRFLSKNITPELENYRGNIGCADGPKGIFREQPTPVGMFPANAWGLHEMHGNAWEWCLDHLRGGSWCDRPRYCRSACRFHGQPVGADDDIGLRVVCRPQRPSLNS